MASSGVGGRAGASSLDGPSAEGTAQTGLRACAEEAGQKVLPPGHTGDTCAQDQTLPAGGWDPVPPSAPKVWVTSPPFPDMSHFS